MQQQVVYQWISTVTIGGAAALVNNGTWSATGMQITVPSAANTGNVVVTVNGVASNAVSFTIVKLLSLSPTSGTTGTQVTITGSGFGSTQGTSTVTFNGVAATVTSANWTAMSIKANVPSAATTGNVVVTVSGVASNAVPFTVTPNIVSLSPTTAVRLEVEENELVGVFRWNWRQDG